MRLIDADALMEWAVNIGCDGRWGISIDDLTDAIEDAPTIDHEKHGKWVVEEGACEPVYMECSFCGWIIEYYGGLEEEWNYCPHCGARME